MRCPPVRIDQSAWKFRATLQIALNGVFHPPASSWCWQRASVLHRAGSLPSLSVPAYHWSLFSEEGRGEYRGFGVRRGGHPRHRVAHIPPQTLGSGTSPFQGVKTATRGSDTSRCQAIYFFLIRSKSTSPSVSIIKRHSEARTVAGVRTSTWVRAGGCRLCLQWQRPTHKKERMKERKKGRKTTPLPRCLSDGK